MSEKSNEIVEEIKDDIEDVKQEIKETPKEEQDTEWRTELNLTLEAIQQSIADLAKAKGASAEIATLTSTIRELAAEVSSLKTTPPQSTKPVDAADLPSQETKTETLSETEALKTEPPARKNNRAWIR